MHFRCWHQSYLLHQRNGGWFLKVHSFCYVPLVSSPASQGLSPSSLSSTRIGSRKLATRNESSRIGPILLPNIYTVFICPLVNYSKWWMTFQSLQQIPSSLTFSWINVLWNMTHIVTMVGIWKPFYNFPCESFHSIS